MLEVRYLLIFIILPILASAQYPKESWKCHEFSIHIAPNDIFLAKSQLKNDSEKVRGYAKNTISQHLGIEYTYSPKQKLCNFNAGLELGWLKNHLGFTMALKDCWDIPEWQQEVRTQAILYNTWYGGGYLGAGYRLPINNRLALDIRGNLKMLLRIPSKPYPQEYRATPPNSNENLLYAAYERRDILAPFAGDADWNLLWNAQIGVRIKLNAQNQALKIGLSYQQRLLKITDKEMDGIFQYFTRVNAVTQNLIGSSVFLNQFRVVSLTIGFAF